jgi:hypothetical protein
MHPMMIWWAILYSLSMLTRYRVGAENLVTSCNLQVLV